MPIGVLVAISNHPSDSSVPLQKSKHYITLAVLKRGLGCCAIESLLHSSHNLAIKQCKLHITLIFRMVYCFSFFPSCGIYTCRHKKSAAKLESRSALERYFKNTIIIRLGPRGLIQNSTFKRGGFFLRFFQKSGKHITKGPKKRLKVLQNELDKCVIMQKNILKNF